MTPVRVTLLTAEGCHYCADAKEVLACLGREWPIDLEEISFFSERGAELALRDGVAFPPGVYVDGQFFSQGRLSERKLRRHVQERRTP